MRSRALAKAATLWRSRDGVAALEFALAVPVLVLLMAGAISFGVAYRMRMEVGNAARAGAAYASAHGFSQPGIKTAAQGATALSNVSVTATEVTSSCADPATGAIISAGGAQTCTCSGSAPGTYVTVTAQMPYTLILAPPGMASSVTLTGVAIARIQ